MTAAGRRSAIPKVMGILMIIFGSLGLLSALSNLGSSGFDQIQSTVPDTPVPGLEALKDAERIMRVLGLIGLPISGLHIFAGIRATAYKANGPRLSLIYAASAALHTTVSTIVAYIVLVPAFEAMSSGMAGIPGGGLVQSSMKFFLIVGAMIGLIWPVLVGVLMSRPAARDACAW